MLKVQHQIFAERLAARDSPPKAYKAAYPKVVASTANGRGSKLAKKDHIKAEVERLRRAAQEKGLFLEMNEKRQFLADVVRTPAGKIHKDHPLCQSYKVAADGTVEIKMPDKVRCIVTDNDLAGEGAQAGADGAIMSLADRVAGIRNHRKLPR